MSRLPKYKLEHRLITAVALLIGLACVYASYLVIATGVFARIPTVLVLVNAGLQVLPVLPIWWSLDRRGTKSLQLKDCPFMQDGVIYIEALCAFAILPACQWYTLSDLTALAHDRESWFRLIGIVIGVNYAEAMVIFDMRLLRRRRLQPQIEKVVMPSMFSAASIGIWSLATTSLLSTWLLVEHFNEWKALPMAIVALNSYAQVAFGAPGWWRVMSPVKKDRPPAVPKVELVGQVISVAGMSYALVEVNSDIRMQAQWPGEWLAMMALMSLAILTQLGITGTFAVRLVKERQGGGGSKVRSSDLSMASLAKSREPEESDLDGTTSDSDVSDLALSDSTDECIASVEEKQKGTVSVKGQRG